MPWRVEKHSNHEIIQIIYEGKIDFDDITQATISAIGQAESSYSNKFINILYGVEINISAHELHNINFLWEKANASKVNKLAIVDVNSSISDNLLSFFISTSQNLGWNVKDFLNIDSAISWLQNDSE